MTTQASASGPTVRKPKPLPIKQSEMDEILNQRLVVDTLKRDLKKSEEELLKLELILIDRVQNGGKQEAGALSIAVEMKPAQSHTPWKELYAKQVGPKQVEIEMSTTRELNAANAKPKLVVMSEGKVEKTA